VLARLAREVWSLERRPELAAAAARNPAAQHVGNVHVLAADGSEGLPGEAPFDAIVVAAAFPLVPATLVRQLAEDAALDDAFRNPSGAAR
jgi:protein-L-isoaspartate(D-aspartate) O-methyltransferase